MTTKTPPRRRKSDSEPRKDIGLWHIDTKMLHTFSDVDNLVKFLREYSRSSELDSAPTKE